MTKIKRYDRSSLGENKTSISLKVKECFLYRRSLSLQQFDNDDQK